jgi:hypothetical protein
MPGVAGVKSKNEKDVSTNGFTFYSRDDTLRDPTICFQLMTFRSRGNNSPVSGLVSNFARVVSKFGFGLPFFKSCAPMETHPPHEPSSDMVVTCAICTFSNKNPED